MSLFSRHLAALACAACLAPALAYAAPLPAKTLTDLPAITGVTLSRDGKHIAALTSADGETATISVWRTEALDQPPSVIAANRVRIQSASFLKNDRLLIRTIQTFTVGAAKGHLAREFVSDLEGKSWTNLLPDARGRSETETFMAKFGNARLLSSLPQDPRHVVVEDERPNSQGDILKVDVYSGEAERLEHASEKFAAVQIDLTGQPRARRQIDFEGERAYVAQWLKNPDSGKWEEHFRTFAKDRETFDVIGFTPDLNLIYIRSDKGRDKAGIYEYDIRRRKILEPLFEHKMFEAKAVMQSTRSEDYGAVLGFVYAGASSTPYWTDARLAPLNKTVRAALGVATAAIDWIDPATGDKGKIGVVDGVDAQITGWSDDLKLFIVTKSGPRQPDEYYLLDSSGKLQLLGAARPELDLTALGPTQLVEYPARDGLMIPAYLTTPPASFGPGPFPTLILPHGGPWARDEMGWDRTGWNQYFASRGYAVLQPQFRGSKGWGQKLWRAGDNQWGAAMQDDKDDGARWLIERKVAAPDRVAIFGYSYGGYAALAGAIRPNGLYQCAVAGAAGTLASMKRATSENRILRELQRPAVDGLDAMAHAREVKIPILLYHGDRDQIVDIKESRKFAAELKAAAKPFRYLEIKDMGHTLNTWTPQMAAQQLVEIEQFLTHDCGPGGL